MPVNKVRRNGSYAPLSAHYYKDDAVQEAGEKAEVLFTRGMAFCADVLSDGFISDRQLRIVGVGLSGVAARAAALVTVGLWRRDDDKGGYWLVSWLKWNRSREEIAELAEKDNRRKSTSDSERKPTGFRTDSAPRARTPRHDTPTPGGTRERASPPEPSRQCPIHSGQPNPGPCGPCGDARRAHDQWATDRNNRIRTMPTCPTHRGQLAHNCGLCRADQLAADA